MEKNYDPATYPQEWNYLQPGTIIDRYMIEKELASGGFSSVYLARRLSDQYQVAIKEYLPRKLAHRTWQNRVVPHSEKTKSAFLRGKALFMEEAKILAGLKHPNIIEVTNFFKENSTVYMVMTYDYGKSLLSSIKKHNKAGFTLPRLIQIFMPLLDGISLIHSRDLLHLDIKPQNILIRPAGDPVLLDFGAAHHYRNKDRCKPTKVLSNGFSPVEQYPANGKLGPWSDIYATGATLRTCLDGYPPPPAPDRRKEDPLIPAIKAYKHHYPRPLLEAVDAALEIEPENRPQSVPEFLAILKPHQ